jgi:hypothetical protein
MNKVMKQLPFSFVPEAGTTNMPTKFTRFSKSHEIAIFFSSFSLREPGNAQLPERD